MLCVGRFTMPVRSFTRWGFALLGLSLTLGVVAADDPNEKAIKARRAAMTLQSWYAGPLFQMAKGAMEYDAEMAKTYAANLDAVVNIEAAAMWSEGTDNAAYEGKTRALPEIWTTWPEAGKKAQALVDASADLAAVAGEGLDALRSKIGAVGNACKGCHDDFRAEKM